MSAARGVEAGGRGPLPTLLANTRAGSGIDPVDGSHYGGTPLPVGPLPLHVETIGSGSPIVLLHGFGANSSTWHAWSPGLARRGTVHLVDLMGFGRAPKPRDRSYGPHDLADSVVELILREGLTNLTLIGHSLGGGVALLTALRLIDLGESERLRSLVLVSAASMPQALPRFMRVGRIRGLGAFGARMIPSRALVRTVLKRIVYDPTAVTASQVDSYARTLTGEGKRTAMRALGSIVPVDIVETAARYPEIDTPTLLLWGAQDPVVRLPVAEALGALLPDARLSVLDRCGHVPPQERPGESFEIVDRFLRDQGLPEVQEESEP